MEKFYEYLLEKYSGRMGGGLETECGVREFVDYPERFRRLFRLT